MKYFKIFLSLLLLITLLCTAEESSDLIAAGKGGRGGGGRDGGGGRGGGGGHKAMSRDRTPSMSPARGKGEKRSKPANRPADKPKPKKQNLQDLQRNRIDSKEEVKKYIKDNQSRERKRRVDNPEQFKKDLQSKRAKDKPRADKARKNWNKKYPHYHHWFDDRFFDHHHIHPRYYYPGWNWWQPLTWGTVAYWLGNGSWDSPVYYDTDDYYVNLPPESYDQSTVQKVSGDWLPLGVFVAAKSIEDADYSPFVIQLAVNKEGDVAGTYYNTSKDQAYELDGKVVKQTQEIVWKLSDQSYSPLMTTGVYNITESVVPVTVHFPSGENQSWVLVRLEE